MMWFIPLITLVVSAGCEPVPFDPFFGDEISYFSPGDDGDFGKFSGFSFHPGGGSILNSEFKGPFGSESSDLPLYTDGKATPPQATLSKLGRDYKEQLHRAAGLRPNYPPPSLVGYGASSQQQSGRLPRFQSKPFSSSSSNIRTESHSAGPSKIKNEPFYSASTIDERRPSQDISSGKFKNEGTDRTQTYGGGSSNSQPEIQTGFVPIFKGQEKRTQSSQSSGIIKDLPPPILTAESVSATARPTVFKVSASVQSSPKVPALSQQRASSGNSSSNDRHQAAYSRSLVSKDDAKHIRVTSSVSSESVVSRVVSKPPSVQPKSPVPEESRLSAKKTLDINCEGSRDLGWCELGDKYPKKYVNQVAAACQEVIQRMYIEVPHNFEKLSDTSNFKAELNISGDRAARERGGSHDAWSWASYFHEGSLCEAETGFLRPETAKDSSGKWNIIVQTETIKQRVPIEMCRKTNSSCKKMLECGQKSQCLQKYNYHLLLSLNPTQKHDCPFMKLYRFPSACVCHVE